MPNPSVASAREFVSRAQLPALPKTRGPAPTPIADLAFDTAKNEAAVVGSEIVSFVQGVTADRREAIVNSALLAQQVATSNVPDKSKVMDWYGQYFDALTQIGWVIQETNFQDFRETSKNFEANKAILAVATMLLGAAPTALALVTTTLESLQSMDNNNPWITLFSRESQSAKTARFQITLAEQAADGQFLVTLMAFVLEAKSTVTQVLFFKAKTKDARLQHASGKVTINTVVLDSIAQALKEKLTSIAQDYIKKLPDFHPRALPRGARSAAGPKAQSLHIGLNAVDPAQYGGWSGDLVACEFDANDMAAIARSAGIQSTTLLTKKATRASVLGAFRSASKAMKSGDLLLLTYSGHGGQIPDVSGDEADKLDETWCLYDGELIDDEIFLELSCFAAGVRIFVLSDSCHSGTVTRAVLRPDAGGMGSRPRMMPPAIAMRTYREHKAFYDKIQQDVAKAYGKSSTPASHSAQHRVAVSRRLTAIANSCKASAILISGCQDNQTSADGDHNGAFTEQLLQVWDHGRFKGNYAQFYAAIKARMPTTQVPNLFTLGPASSFLTQKPFSV